jgi:hypothetical protein
LDKNLVSLNGISPTSKLLALVSRYWNILKVISGKTQKHIYVWHGTYLCRTLLHTRMESYMTHVNVWREANCHIVYACWWLWKVKCEICLPLMPSQFKHIYSHSINITYAIFMHFCLVCGGQLYGVSALSSFDWVKFMHSKCDAEDLC